MRTFDIEEFKKHPDRKLILRHYRKDCPEVWSIEEVQLTIGDRLMIKVPETGYDTDEYVLLDGFEVRDRNGNLVGAVEFAAEAVSLEDFAGRLFRLQENETLDFSCSDTEDECQFGATKIRRFDSVLIILASYGGKNSHIHDITGDKDSGELCESLRYYLQDYLEDSIYIDLRPKTRKNGTERNFTGRIDTLRQELIQSITELLKSNGISELEFPSDMADVVYVVWFDNDGNAYDSPVRKVMLCDENNIALEVYEEYANIRSTLYAYDLACQNLDWLDEVRDLVQDILRRRNAIELTVLDNGDLEMTVANREEFENIISREYDDERAYLCDLLEESRYLGNDWHCPYDIGLTETPAIAQGAIYPEDKDYDGEPVDYENLWYYPDYMLNSYLEILNRNGKFVFTAHKDNKIK